ncbi:MAG: ATP-binding protein, partial [Candidatus Saccharimonadales bacterium]
YRSILQLEDATNTPIDDSNDPVRQAIATGADVHSENYTILTESGKRRLLSVTASPQAKGAALVVVRDITESKKEERGQAEFISTASHEMRTPVASIEGYLGLVLNLKTINLDPKAREYIDKAHEGAQHLGRLLQDLLDVSKADDGRLQNSPRVIELTEYVGDIAEGLRPKALLKGLVFTYKPSPLADREQAEKVVSPVFYAHVDKDHLREVVANLIENAIKYTPHGDVTVDVTGNNTDIRISVSDSGIGIPAEDIGHLFQKFYRVDNSQTREIGGTGLGLYLSRRLTEIMGGRIWVESQLQKGSTFFVEIPRITHEEAERLQEEEKATHLTKTNQSIDAPNIMAPAPAPISASIPAPTPIHPSLPPPTPIALPITPLPPIQQPSATPAPTLATIEQNPTAFVAAGRTPSVQIPTRDDSTPTR